MAIFHENVLNDLLSSHFISVVSFTSNCIFITLFIPWHPFVSALASKLFNNLSKYSSRFHLTLLVVLTDSALRYPHFSLFSRVMFGIRTVATLTQLQQCGSSGLQEINNNQWPIQPNVPMLCCNDHISQVGEFHGTYT